MKNNASQRVRTLVLTAFLSATGVISPAITINWTNLGTADFATAANWSPNQVPAEPDNARIINGGTITIADGASYVVSNLWVAARNVANATGTVQIANGTLSITGGPGQLQNAAQVGNGFNAFGRVEVAGGTLQRYSAFQNPNNGYLFVGGGSGRGELILSSGNVFLDFMRIGSDQSSTTGSGVGYVEVSGGLLVVTNQWVIGRDLDTGILNITGGEVINLAQNFLLSGADDYLTLSGGNGSTGEVTVATGGTLRAEGGIRISHAPDAGLFADGTLRLTGGRLVTQRIFQGGTTGIGLPKVELDGGVIEAASATNVAGFMYFTSTSSTSSNLTVKVKSGGVTIDSAGFDLRVYPPFLADAGSPGGGIIKSNAGTLRLLGANTHTGATTIEGGGLILATASSGGGTVMAKDGSGFGASVSSAGSSLNLSTLTLDAGTGPSDLTFELGVLGNPIAPVISAATLAVNRTNRVNVSGAGLSAGQFTLVQYTSGSGVTPDRFELGSLPAGVSAQLVLEPNQIKLDITAAPSLHWNGNVSADWDTNTANWLDFSTPTPTPTVYGEGSAVQFDDAATTNFVNLVQSLSPAVVTVTNEVVNYEIGGLGLITGAAGLRKQGAAILKISSAANTYSGDTTISAGTLQFGASDVLPQGAGRGNVILNGTLDLNGYGDGINGLTGAGTIDNTSANLAALTVGNAGAPSSFSGTITNSGGGPLLLVKAGNNVLTLTGNNAHSGGTTINAGIVRAGNDTVLGTGTLILSGGTLSSDGAAARSFANPVLIDEGSALGSSVDNGFLSLSGLVDFAGTVRGLTVNSDALFSGGSGNGALNKLGPATLTLQGVHDWNSIAEVRNGTVILDGATVTTSEAFRTDCDQPGGTARLVIGPGSTWVQNATGANLRAGTDGNTTATNIVDIAGSVSCPIATEPNGRIQLGVGSTIGFVNLLTNGVAAIRSVAKGGTGNYCEFNFNGGTLQAVADNTAFMEGLSNAFIRGGSATIDSAGFNITIAQDLLDGGGNGGLTKIGTGTLFLNGNNTYTGSTIVSNGALGGVGTLAGPLLVTSAGTFAPGSPVGTLTLNNTLTLQGTTLMELSRDSGAPASDLVMASTLNRGGALVITNSGVSALRSGDSFNLFDWTTVSGAFATVSLPALLPGLSWNADNLPLDGSISIGGSEVPPRFNAPVLSGSDLNLSGTGGLAGGTYYVLASPELGAPVTNWIPVATNVFDGSGHFSFTDAVEPGVPQRFYLIAIP